MGAMQAQAWAGMVEGGEVSLELAVEAHLTSNHYPPVNRVFVPAAVSAIKLYADGDLDETVELPNGRILSVTEVVDQLHLDAFVDAWLATTEDDDVDSLSLDHDFEQAEIDASRGEVFP